VRRRGFAFLQNLITLAPASALTASVSVVYLRVAIAVCALVGLYDVLFFIGNQLDDRTLANTMRPLMSAPTVFPDFIGPYGAVQAYLEGKLAIVYDFQAFPDFLKENYGEGATLQPLLYPPVWILAMLPFGLLPVYAAFPAFIVFTIAIFAIESRHHPWVFLIAATSPAALWAVMSGQSTFLYVALFYSGMRLVERSPAAGGMLLGLLVYKPHICLLVPIALLASRQWKALAWMVGTGTVVVLMSVVVLGPQAWLDYVAMSGQMSGQQKAHWLVKSLEPWLISPFAAMLIVDVPAGAASAIQFATTIFAAVAVWFVFRRYPDSAARTAILVAGALLASPYMLYYDVLLLIPVMVALYGQSADDGFRPLEALVYFLLFVQPMTMWWTNRHAPIAPVLIVLFGVFAMLRLQRTLPPPRPGDLQSGST
jgi:hypothetical protein